MRIGVILSCALAAFGSVAAMAYEAAQPSVDALGAIVGTWQSDVVNGVSARSSCSWTAHHTGVVCDQSITMPDGEHHILSIYTFDPTARKYFFYLIQQPGEASTPVTMTINNGIWTYGGAGAGSNGRWNRTINDFAGGKDSYTWRVESSTDGQHWTKVTGGKSTRVGETAR